MFHHITPEQYNGIFDSIGKQWMLVTAQKPDGTFNTMTASWGGMGVLWNKNVFFCFVRPQRFTHEFTEAADEITLSFLGEECRDALKVCGSKSGRDCDKVAEAKLTPVKDGNFVYFEQASTVICGKKLYTDKLKESGFIGVDPKLWYKDNDYHTIYVCEIVKVLEK